MNIVTTIALGGGLTKKIEVRMKASGVLPSALILWFGVI